MTQYNNRGNHFFVEVIPSIDEQGYWDGKYQLAIQARRANIDDESFWSLQHLCQMVCAGITMMEDSEKVRESVEKFLNTPDNQDIKQAMPIDNVTDNVIKVNFERALKRSEDK